MKKFIFIFLQNNAKFRTTINAVSVTIARHNLAKVVHPLNIIEGFDFRCAIPDDFQLPYQEMAKYAASDRNNNL